MSTIRSIYHPVNGVAKQPGFPATDQHPTAVRYLVGLYYVDALGGAPTQAEVDIVLGLDAASQAEVARTTAIDATITNDTTVTALRAMTNVDFDTWWAANVTNAAQAIGVLKRLVRLVLRRILL